MIKLHLFEHELIIGFMIRSMHLIDDKTPQDMLEQLALLCEHEEVLCLGPLPQYLPSPLQVRQVLPPFRLRCLGGWSIKPSKGSVDLVHIWSPSLYGAGSHTASRLHCPLMLSLPCAPQGQTLETLLKAARATDRHYKFAVTLPDEPQRNAMMAAGAQPEILHVLPPPVCEVSHASEHRSRARHSLGLHEQDIVLASVDDMVPLAGQKLAIWTHAILRQILPNVRLLLPGAGPGEKSIRYFAQTAGYQTDIFFSGNAVSRMECLAAADIALFLGEQDTSPWALAAAKSAGLPIVAASTPGALHALRGNASAIFVPQRDPRQAAAAVYKLSKQTEIPLGMTERAGSTSTPEQSREVLQSIYRQAMQAL